MEDLKEATVNYTSRLALKLRTDKSCATVLSVRLLTNRFKTDSAQAYPAISISLTHPVNNTPDLVKSALFGLSKIYLPGYLFQKVEITATGLIPESEVQLDLFNNWNGKVNNQLSQLMDSINSRYGNGTLRLATEGKSHAWSMNRKFLSPAYTTQWKDILKVK